MKDYQVSYYLGDMYHAYIISARNEDEMKEILEYTIKRIIKELLNR